VSANPQDLIKTTGNFTQNGLTFHIREFYFSSLGHSQIVILKSVKWELQKQTSNDFISYLTCSSTKASTKMKYLTLKFILQGC